MLGKSGPCGAVVNAKIGAADAKSRYTGSNKLQVPPDLKIGQINSKSQIRSKTNCLGFCILVIVICLLFVFCYLKFFITET